MKIKIVGCFISDYLYHSTAGLPNFDNNIDINNIEEGHNFTGGKDKVIRNGVSCKKKEQKA